MGKAISQAFTPEFLGRLDGTVHFAPLQDAAMEAIAWKYLRQLQQRTESMGCQLQIPGELASQLAARSRGRDGARQLRRLVQTEVEGPLASYLLRCSRRPSRIRLELDGEQVSFCS